MTIGNLIKTYQQKVDAYDLDIKRMNKELDESPWDVNAIRLNRIIIKQWRDIYIQVIQDLTDCGY